MNKTTDSNKGIKISVDIKGLMDMCGVGRNTAYQIGEDAGAVIRIGRRKLYNVKKVQEYIDGISGNGKEKDVYK